jgi:hypothetical protein
MGRVYAGTLGPLALTVMICRGWLNSSGVESTLSVATLNLVLFAVIGSCLGHIAQTTIDDSVRSKIEQQLAQHSTPGTKKA